MHLTNNTSQIIQPNTITQVNWQTIYGDTSGGLLTKVDNTIKIGKGVHNVYVHAQFRDEQTSMRKFIYIIKNGEIQSVNSTYSPIQIQSDIIQVDEGDILSINTYQTGTTGITITGIETGAWEYFKVVILN